MVLERIGGPVVATAPYPYFNWDLETETASGTLASGAYRLRVWVTTQGHWWCSQYNPEGCSWIDGGSASWEWRFRYTAGRRLVVPRQYAPPTSEVGVNRKKLGPKRIKLRGRAVGQVLRSDYSLGPRVGLGGRSVLVREKWSGKWRNAARTRTRANGTFEVRVKARQKARPVRVEISAATGSPAAVEQWRMRP